MYNIASYLPTILHTTTSTCCSRTILPRTYLPSYNIALYLPTFLQYCLETTYHPTVLPHTYLPSNNIASYLPTYYIRQLVQVIVVQYCLVPTYFPIILPQSYQPSYNITLYLHTNTHSTSSSSTCMQCYCRFNCPAFIATSRGNNASCDLAVTCHRRSRKVKAKETICGFRNLKLMTTAAFVLSTFSCT